MLSEKLFVSGEFEEPGAVLISGMFIGHDFTRENLKCCLTKRMTRFIKIMK
jgi:hypothetical protein